MPEVAKVADARRRAIEQAQSQGLPEHIEDRAALARVAALIGSTTTERPSTRGKRKPPVFAGRGARTARRDHDLSTPCPEK
jgi:hypothetical protein